LTRSGFRERRATGAETGTGRKQKPGIFTNNESYHLAGGQSNSLALSHMRTRMNTLDILFGTDTYSRLRANLGAGA